MQASTPGQNVRHLLLRGPEAGQLCRLGLEDAPQLEEIPELTLHPLQTTEAEVLDLPHLLRHEGALPPADLQHPLGHQGPDGLPQRGPAHPQLLGELQLIGQLFPRPGPSLRHDPGIQTLRRLLGQALFLHAPASFSS